MIRCLVVWDHFGAVVHTGGPKSFVPIEHGFYCDLYQARMCLNRSKRYSVFLHTPLKDIAVDQSMARMSKNMNCAIKENPVAYTHRKLILSLDSNGNRESVCSDDCCNTN